MSTADRYKALHRGGKYKVLKKDGSFKIKNTGYGSGGGFKTVLKTVKQFVDKNPGTLLLDYGCGSSKIWHTRMLNDMTLTEHLGENLIGFYRYDPFHPKYDIKPNIKFNLIVISEVIEHVPIKEIPALLKDVANLICDDGRIILSIPQQPSHAHFMDGQNMHCTLMTKDNWIKLIRKYIPKHIITINFTP